MTITAALVAERAPLIELNQDCLLALRAAARVTEPVAAHHRFMQALAAEWTALDDRALARLAGAPFTLLDGGLRTISSWIDGAPLGVRDGGQLSDGACFAPATGRILLRRLLAFGWHVARIQPRLARLLLGCDGPAVAALADCSLAQLDAQAEARGHELSVRWVGHTEYWRKLLATASAAAEPQLNEQLQNALRRVAADALRPLSQTA